MQKTVLITGASSGLGAEYARQLSAAGNKIVLVARSETALHDVAGQLRGESEVLVADLLSDNGVLKVMERISNEADPVNFLVNNAGYGLPLDFAANALEDEVKHLRLHNEVALKLTHTALQGMLKNGSGTIINVASVAAFIPRSTYSAVKQWLVTFSRWANGYYKPRGVKISVVCPGFTHTNFHERMGLPPGEEGIPAWMWLKAKDVVRTSLRDADRGKGVSIPSFKYKVIVALTKFLPAGLASRAGETGR